MRILAFETSAKACSVALWQDGRLLAESYQNTGLTHSQTLLTMTEDLLKNCGFSADWPEAVAVAAGPGSFTGVRIGMAAAKGFAWGRQLPLCGVSTLEAMACGLGLEEGYILAVMDARRQQVYNAMFCAEKGKLQRIREDQADSLEDLAENSLSVTGPVYLVGDGSHVTMQALGGRFPNLILPAEHRLHQRAAGVAKLAEQKLLAGERCDGAALEPNYLRLSQAERERLEREKKNG